MSDDIEDIDPEDHEEQPSAPTRRRPRAKKVDVQQLRHALLAKCREYLDGTPIDQLSGSMVKAVADVVTTVGHEFAKEDRSHRAVKVPSSFVLPFPEPDAPGYVDPPRGVVPAKVTPGFPSVPVPSVKSRGGIKQPPVSLPFHDPDNDYSGLQRAG